MKLEEMPIEHPVALRFGGMSDMQLVHMSQKASTTMPKTRKERAPTANPLLAPPMPDTDRLGAQRVEQSPGGGKHRAALVLRFRPDGSAFVADLGAVRISLHQLDLKGHWTARLLLKVGQRWEKRFASRLCDEPGRAVYALANMARWRYAEGQWRSLLWVFKLLLIEGIETRAQDAPKKSTERVYALREMTGGYWCWQNIPKPPAPQAALPDNAGLTRTLKMADIRSEMSLYANGDYDEGGTLDGKPRKSKKTGAIKANEPPRFVKAQKHYGG